MIKINHSAALPKYRADVCKSIKAKHAEVLEGGVLVGANWFHTDPHSLRLYHVHVVLDAELTPGIQWKSMDGTYVVRTVELSKNILKKYDELVTIAFDVKATHIAEVKNSSDPKQYDFSTGWPQVYADTL